jgi:hypothetical protein
VAVVSVRSESLQRRLRAYDGLGANKGGANKGVRTLYLEENKGSGENDRT